MIINLEHDVAAAAAIAAVRPAGCNVLFPVEGNRTVAASACVDAYAGFINK